MAPRSNGKFAIVEGEGPGALVIPKVPAIVRTLRALDPVAVMDAIAPMADEIIREWSRAKNGLTSPAISQSTITRYSDVVYMLEKKYSQARGVELNTLSPMEIVEALFVHSETLEQASWTSYRSAFMYKFVTHIKAFEAEGAPASDFKSYRHALATLIVASRKPAAAPVLMSPPAPKRAKSLTAGRLEKLIENLA